MPACVQRVQVEATGLTIHPGNVRITDDTWENPPNCKSVTVAVEVATPTDTVTVTTDNAVEFEAAGYVETWQVDDKDSVLAEGEIQVAAVGTGTALITYTFVD